MTYFINLRKEIFLLVSINILYFVITIPYLIKLDGLNIIAITFFYISLVTILELLIIFILNNVSKSLVKITFPILLTINLVCIILHMYDGYMLLNIYKKILFILFFLILFFIFIGNIEKINFKFLTSTILIMLIINIFFVLVEFYNYKEKRNFKVENHNIINNQTVFKYKPDVYIFIFDALVPDSITKKFLETETPYNKYINSNMNSYDYFFSDFASTLHTLNSVLFLDNEKWISKNNKNSFITGEFNSPLLDLFKNNDYKISINYKPFSFAKATEYIDLSRHHKKKKLTDEIYFSYCDWISNHYYLRFFGICFFGKMFNRSHVDDSFVQYVASSKKNWLTINYYNEPGHVPYKGLLENNNELEIYKKKFAEKSKIVVQILKGNLEKIKKSNKDSIVFVFGDHGLMLTDPYAFNYKEDVDLVFEDLFLSKGAYLDEKNICENLDEKYLGLYSTPIYLIRNLIKCLSVNDPFLTKPNIDLIYARENNETLKKIEYKRSDFFTEK